MRLPFSALFFTARCARRVGVITSRTASAIFDASQRAARQMVTVQSSAIAAVCSARATGFLARRSTKPDPHLENPAVQYPH